jgi:hypothetical protein
MDPATFSNHAEYIRSTTREEVFGFLDEVERPSKILVIEKPLISIFDLSFKFSELESAGVVRIIEWSDDWSELEDSAQVTFIYIIRALSKQTLPFFTQLGNLCKKKRKTADRKILFTPFVCSLALERLRGLDVIPENEFSTIAALPGLGYAVLEDDTISLQLGEEAFSDYHCRGDPSLLVHIAHFLKGLQANFGAGVGHQEISKNERKIRKINSIGTAGKFVADLFLKLTSGGMSTIDGRTVDEVAAVGDENEIMGGISRIGGIHSIASLLLKSNACSDDIGEQEKSSRKPVNKPVISPRETIDSVVLIDRRSDLFSLLCSQFTYEGLIDDAYGISNNKVRFTPEETDKQPVVMQLSKQSDPLFGNIRDVSVSSIGQILSKKANFISECYKEKDSLKSISEIKDFMEKFKVIQAEHASLSNHVSLATCVSGLTRDSNYTWMLKVEDQIMSMSKPASKIMTKIESMVRRTSVSVFNLERILRLLCLSSLIFGPKTITNSGIDKVIRSIVHRFGFGVIRVVHHLEQCGLIKYYNPAEASGVMSELMSGSSKWPKIREEFKLISDSGEELAEAYSGYIPLSVRLIQLLNSSWKVSADKLDLLRGPALEIAQECPIATGVTGNSVYVAVIFIGGVTYGEIAALRRLSALEGGKRKFLIVTTGITNCSKVIRSM